MVENDYDEYEDYREIKLPKINFGKIQSLGSGMIILILIAIWVLSGVYIVDPDEQGVVRRFGKMVRTTTSGINYHLPWPIERADTPKVTEVKRLEVGFRTIDPGPPARYRKVAYESVMLTGDENIVDCEIIVQYKIKDAPDYLFNVRDKEESIRAASESALRQIIGKHNIDEALTTGKHEIQVKTQELLQKIFDKYDFGLLVVAVQLQDVHPPKDVVQAFKDVASAKEDKNKLINLAQGYNNDVIPKTRGQAQKILREAEAYREERINRAQGDVERFLKVLGEYRKAKEVTARRLYLETLEKILPKVKKVIAKTGKDGSNFLGVLPIEPLMGSEKGGER
ncbi:MAG: FtsH protease activity modulator HflK [Candidatus Glassbacteria bacterium]